MTDHDHDHDNAFDAVDDHPVDHPVDEQSFDDQPFDELHEPPVHDLWADEGPDHVGEPDAGDLPAPHDTAAELPPGDQDAAAPEPVDAGADDPVEVFPPALDVGELPEPVDGFPWIDAAGLGVPGPGAAEPDVSPVGAEELAEYAGVELPPGADPWAELTASDDPATGALARWWKN